MNYHFEDNCFLCQQMHPQNHAMPFNILNQGKRQEPHKMTLADERKHVGLQLSKANPEANSFYWTATKTPRGQEEIAGPGSGYL